MAGNHTTPHISRQLPSSLRQLAAQLPDLVMILSLDGLVQEANPAFSTILKYTPREMEGKAYHTLLPQEEGLHLEQMILLVRAQGAVSGCLHHVVDKTGTPKIISWSCTLLDDSNILCVGRDMTELIERQRRQDAKENLFQALIENSFDMLALTDADGRYLYVSDTMSDFFGYTSKELLGTICFSYMHPDDLPRIMENNMELHSHQKKIHVAPYRFRHADGYWLWLESVVTNQLNHPDIRGVVVSARDINSKYEMELRLKEMQLMEALMEGEEKERSRIARDLHDGVASIIAGAKMQLSALADQMQNVREKQEFRQSIHLLDTAAAQVRNTSHNLMPELLLERGLDEAMKRYCQTISNAKIQVLYASVGTVKRFSPNFELSLYRILQELIGNILKHSGASSAFVQSSFQDKVLSFTIEDNGIGFNPQLVTKGTGLSSIQKRVISMNGTIDICSKPGNGTSIYLEFVR